MLEKELRANWDAVFYPEPEPEAETFGEEVQPVEPPVLLASGPSGTVSDAGAAFGVFPQMKPRRAGRSDIGANLPVLAADVVAGAGKGTISGVVGLPGDLLALGRGLYEIGRRGGDEGKLDAFLRGMEAGTIVPTSDDVDKWLTKNIGPVVPSGVEMEGARTRAASAGRLAGELVADPVAAVKGAKAVVKGAKAAGKALAPKAGEMLDAYMQRTGLQQNLMAYHGTPHSFDKFDASKIGTGEGAQAYGFGLYFAEGKGVAKDYQTRLSSVGSADVLVSQYGGVDQAIAEAQRRIDSYSQVVASGGGGAMERVQGLLRVNQKALKDLNDMKAGKPPNQGVLYTVDIPDAMVSKMLDWDKPLKDQPEALAKIKAAGYEPDPDMTAGRFIESKSGNGFDEYLAADLQKAGIPGVRYLDQGSRGDGKGTRNIVVFPGGEDQVKILKVNDNKATMPQSTQEPK